MCSSDSPQHRQEQEELPPWARKEKERELAALEKDLPFGVYLLGSAIVAIAAVQCDHTCSVDIRQVTTVHSSLHPCHADRLMV